MYYFSLLKEQIKLSFMSVAIFRGNFLLMLLQSILNSVMGIVSVEFIYLHVKSIAGWTKSEMIILLCTSLIVNQLYRGLINPNHMRFLRSVSSGSFDRMLIKPVNLIFQINTGTVDCSSFLSLIAPIVVLCAQVFMLDYSVTWRSLLLFFVCTINAVLLLTSFMLLLYSLAFKFIKVDGLTGVYYTLMSISEKPKEIFPGKALSSAFIFLIPAIPLANAPASMLIGKSNGMEALVAAAAGMLFFLLSIAAVKTGVSKYSSASS